MVGTINDVLLTLTLNPEQGMREPTGPGGGGRGCPRQRVTWKTSNLRLQRPILNKNMNEVPPTLTVILAVTSTKAEENTGARGVQRMPLAKSALAAFKSAPAAVVVNENTY